MTLETIKRWTSQPSWREGSQLVNLQPLICQASGFHRSRLAHRNINAISANKSLFCTSVCLFSQQASLRERQIMTEKQKFTCLWSQFLPLLCVFQGCISRRRRRAGVTINKSIKEGESEREGGKEPPHPCLFYSVWHLVDSSGLFLIPSAYYSFRAACSLDHKPS